MKKFKKMELKSMDLVKGGCTHTTTVSSSTKYVRHLEYAGCTETETSSETETEINIF